MHLEIVVNELFILKAWNHFFCPNFMVSITNIHVLKTTKLVIVGASSFCTKISNFVVLESSQIDIFEVTKRFGWRSGVSPLRINEILCGSMSINSYSFCGSSSFSFGTCGCSPAFIMIVLNVVNNPHSCLLELLNVILY